MIMTNKKNMPTVLVLLILSWVIAIAGLMIAGYFVTFKSYNSLIIILSILLGSMLFAAIIRMFANIGQMIFDLIKDIKILLGESRNNGKVVKEAISGLRMSVSSDMRTVNSNLEMLCEEGKNNREALKEAISGLRMSVSSDMRTVNSNLEMLCEEGRNNREVLIEAIKKAMSVLNNAISTDMKVLSENLQKLSHTNKINSEEVKEAICDVLEVFKKSHEQTSCDLKDISQGVFQLKLLLEQEAVKETVIDLNRNISLNMKEMRDIVFSGRETLKVSYEQIGCNLNDMLENIAQIRVFFGQIEKHLNLAK